MLTEKVLPVELAHTVLGEEMVGVSGRGLMTIVVAAEEAVLVVTQPPVTVMEQDTVAPLVRADEVKVEPVPDGVQA